MRILLVSHYALPHYGGIEVVVENLARGLVEQGHEVKILSSRIAGPAREERYGFEIIRVPAWNLLERYAVPYPLFSPRLVPETQRLVVWADLVHAHGFLYQPTLVALWLARRIGRPRVLTEHAGFVQYNRWFWNAVQSIAIHTLGRLAVSLADAIVLVGARPSPLIRRLAPPGKPILLIPNGVDIQLFHPVSPEEKRQIRENLGWDERPKVLFVGRFVPQKGIDILAAATDERYDWVLCGRGEVPAAIRHTAIVYPPMPQTQLRFMYQAADIFVLLSRSEGGLPLVAQEAMACGLPVVIMYDPAYLQQVSPEVVCFVEPSADAMREALLQLVGDVEQRKALGERAAQWAQARFSWERTVREYLRLYEQLRDGGAHER